MSVEPTRVLAVRWRCPFCPRGWSRRPTAVQHIQACRSNPERRGCPTCVHFQQAEVCCVSLCEAPGACGADADECAQGIDISRSQIFDCPSWTAKEATS